jgi:long-chain-fatty-acid--[acyl-carrier-protein] ligase
MIRLLISLLHFILGLRYRIQVQGLDAIKKNDGRGILFIPNHPALIDPPIVFSSLYPRFKLRPLADENQVNGPVLRLLMKKIRCVTIPDMTLNSRQSKQGVLQGLAEVVAGLKQGDQFLFYPSGRVYRSRYESLRGNSGVAQILKKVPDVRVVLVRTTGLWGSCFSRASGEKPALFKDLGMKIRAVLAGFIFFVPRREVLIELSEPDDFPRSENRLALNKYLEQFYNKKAPANSYVPYFWWHGRGAITKPEPVVKAYHGDIAGISGETRRQVFARIADVSGNDNFKESSVLASEVGLDSLAVAELGVWIEQEFGHVVDDIEALISVSDVLLAASGQLVSTRSDRDVIAPHRWHQAEDSTHLKAVEATTITALFLAQAMRKPSLPIMADLIGGIKTYRDMVTGIFALMPAFKKMEETNIGLMLPAGVTCTIAYYSLLFAGKTPVMVNFTMGEVNLNYCLAKVGVSKVITARALLTKLEGQGFKTEGNPFSWVCLEDVGRDLSLAAKLVAKLKSYTSMTQLARVKVQDIAAILFTSGSEARPKAVPLTHENFIANVADVNFILGIRADDVLVGMLPPFHSLGLTGTVILPMSFGMQVVYHANPTEAAILAKLIQEYRVTVLLGTPTFLHGILRGAEKNQLSSLRLVFTGAEKCPVHVYETLAREYPQTIMCEGYGVTECAPLISVNHPANPVMGSIGRVLESMEYVLVDPESKDVEVPPGSRGMLLVRGKNVFAGYLHYEGNQPFVDFAGKQWYETGDLIQQDQQGVLYFAGRLKRFVKLGGEMISLPAIEAVLLENLDLPEHDGVLLAVEATADEEHPELILFAVADLNRHQVNKAIRQGGLSPLHNIRKVIQVAEIPVLGTGKTDYQSLKKMLLLRQLNSEDVR